MPHTSRGFSKGKGSISRRGVYRENEGHEVVEAGFTWVVIVAAIESNCAHGSEDSMRERVAGARCVAGMTGTTYGPRP